MASKFADTAKAVWKSLVDKSVKGFFISPTWYGVNPLEYVTTTSIMDVWDDLREFVASPWYQPLVFTRQALGPFWWFTRELLLKSPVFWIVSIFASARWVYNDYYRFLAVGRGGTPSTFYGWYRTKVLLFITNYILRVDVFGAPFVHPMFEPYRGILFDLPPRQGERPTILGLAPSAKGTKGSAH